MRIDDEKDEETIKKQGEQLVDKVLAKKTSTDIRSKKGEDHQTKDNDEDLTENERARNPKIYKRKSTSVRPGSNGEGASPVSTPQLTQKVEVGNDPKYQSIDSNLSGDPLLHMYQPHNPYGTKQSGPLNVYLHHQLAAEKALLESP